ncbi:unnamed protein product [Enterobius vermicularis]|uniref:NTR domain-containing protein n=1 Tax=Enterobius vermicularis TaxID=51028 RepID=A0A0N4UWT7_ENTVE|nr:unnamed protein product [Enterobius vermicularis]
MKYRCTALFLSVVLLEILLPSTAACSCAKVTAQKAFCRADWVCHVHIDRGSSLSDVKKRLRPPTDYFRYDVKHIEIFKVFLNLKLFDLPTAVYTFKEASACGIQLRIGKDYLLSGTVNEGNLMTGICSQLLEPSHTGVIMEWSAVSDNLKKKLRNDKLVSSCN